MVWFALVVIAVAGLVYVTLRYWSEADLRRAGATRPDRPRRTKRSEERPFAPDDDDEFLRELDRRRLHGDE